MLLCPKFLVNNLYNISKIGNFKLFICSLISLGERRAEIHLPLRARRTIKFTVMRRTCAMLLGGLQKWRRHAAASVARHGLLRLIPDL